MNTRLYWILGLIMITLSSCDLIAGIFKAGVWTGIFVVAALIALVFWMLARAGKSK